MKRFLFSVLLLASLGLIILWLQPPHSTPLEKSPQSMLVLSTPLPAPKLEKPQPALTHHASSLSEIIHNLGVSTEGYQRLSQHLNETLTQLNSLQEAEALALELERALKDPENPVPATLFGAYHVLSQQYPTLRNRYQKQFQAWPETGLLRWLVER
jgi:hypothetical protein